MALACARFFLTRVTPVAAVVGVACIAKPIIEEWMLQRSLDRKANAQAKAQADLIDLYCQEAVNQVEIGEEMEEEEVAPLPQEADEQILPREDWIPNGELIDGFEVVVPPPMPVAQAPPPAAKVSDKRQKLPKRGLPYATRVGLEARAQVGLLERTKANFLVYQRICRDIMKEHGVRTTHIATTLPVAIAAAFNPSINDIISSRAIGGTFISERHRLLGKIGGR
nr:tombus P33-like protein [Tolivirales sp.]